MITQILILPKSKKCFHTYPWLRARWLTMFTFCSHMWVNGLTEYCLKKPFGSTMMKTWKVARWLLRLNSQCFKMLSIRFIFIYRVISEWEIRNSVRKKEAINGPICMRDEMFQHFTNAQICWAHIRIYTHR